MAWMLCEEVIKSMVSFVAVYLLKRLVGVSVAEECLIEKCRRPRVKRGLCLKCYSRAKDKVDASETTWEKLAVMRLCIKEANPFDDAYSQAMEGE